MFDYDVQITGGTNPEPSSGGQYKLYRDPLESIGTGVDGRLIVVTAATQPGETNELTLDNLTLSGARPARIRSSAARCMWPGTPR